MAEAPDSQPPGQPSASRLVAIETLLMHLQKAVEDLDLVVREREKRLDTLERRVERLERRVQSLDTADEDSAGGPALGEPPFSP